MDSMRSAVLSVKKLNLASAFGRFFLFISLLLLAQPVHALEEWEWFFPKNPSQYLYTWTPLVGNSAPDVQIRGAEGTADFLWFQGEYDPDYVHGDPTPEGNTLIKHETLPGPNRWEGENNEWSFHISSLEYMQLDDIKPIWVSVECEFGTASYEFKWATIYWGPKTGWWPTYEMDWAMEMEFPELDRYYLSWSSNSDRSYIRGTDFSEGFSAPALNYRFRSPWTLTFYVGETGDTSQLLYEIDDRHPHNIGMGNVFFKDYVQQDPVRIWARMQNDELTLDTESILFETIEPEDIELTWWPESVKSADAGNEYVLRPEFNIAGFGIKESTLYWGETGDTTNPFLELGVESVPILKVTVPDEPRQLWGRLKTGNLEIDTPTTLISPLPKTAPVIIDEPDDIVLDWPEWEQYLIGRKVTAVGGNLTFEWFSGEAGDTSTPLNFRFSPLWDGNARFMDVTKPENSLAVWVRVSNELGSVDSRTMRVLGTFDQPVRFLRTPLRTRLRVSDMELVEQKAGSWKGLWGKMSTYQNVFLMRELEDGTWDSVYLDRFRMSGGDSDPYIGPSQKQLQGAFKSLPTGRYRYSVWAGGERHDSEPFTLVNEFLDEKVLEPYPAVYPVLAAKDYSNGGIFSASVYCSPVIDAKSMQMYAGAIGDRSKPVEFSSNYSRVNSRSYWRNQIPAEIVLQLEWAATGDDIYWLEAKTLEGDRVRSVLKYPTDLSVAPGNILLPPGADIIPIPNLDTLPDVSNWKLGDHDTAGTDIRLPLKITEFTGAAIDLTLWNESQEAVDSLNVEIGHSVPPPILQTSNYAVVTPGGRVLWTSDVIGDLTRTEAYIDTGDGVWQFIQEDLQEINEGFIVPPEAVRLKTVYWREDSSSEATYELSRMPQSFIDNVEATKNVENTLLTDRMGTFVDISGYPEIRHAELGWMHVHPHEGGLIFLGETAPGRTDWNWTHPDIFPAIYSFGKQTWLYYWINGYGWFWDYSIQDWYQVGG